MDEKGINKPLLITALVIAYNSGEYIYEAIDSVLIQDYPRIELIVSDDGSTDFDVLQIREYIERHQQCNIERLIVRKNDFNLGTVKHLERMRSLATGEIEIAIAGDDCWYDASVFSCFAQRFDEMGPEALFITSQVEMRDSSLDNVLEHFVTPAVRQMLKNGDMHSLRELEVYRCAIPGAGSAFRREFFERIGELSRDYAIVEDWTSHVRWLMMGGRIFWLDKTTLIHREGGTSHAIGTEFPPHYRKYRHDLKNLFILEIEPNKDKLCPQVYKKALELHRFNEALCLSLDYRLSVFVPLHHRSAEELSQVVTSVCQQTNLNYELIFCCAHDIADWVINYTSDTYLKSRTLRRIRIVDCEEWNPTVQSQMQEAANGDFVLTVNPGETPSSNESFLGFLYYSITDRKMLDAEAPIIQKISESDTRESRASKPSRNRRLEKLLNKCGSYDGIKSNLIAIMLLLLSIYLLEQAGLYSSASYIWFIAIFVLGFSIIAITIRAICFGYCKLHKKV